MIRELYVDGELHVEFGISAHKHHTPRVILDGALDLPLELFWHLLNDPQVRKETEKRYATFSLAQTRK